MNKKSAFIVVLPSPKKMGLRMANNSSNVMLVENSF